jgi:hypothetical protein
MRRSTIGAERRIYAAERGGRRKLSCAEQASQSQHECAGDSLLKKVVFNP